MPCKCPAAGDDAHWYGEPYGAKALVVGSVALAIKQCKLVHFRLSEIATTLHQTLGPALPGQQEPSQEDLFVRYNERLRFRPDPRIHITGTVAASRSQHPISLPLTMSRPPVDADGFPLLPASSNGNSIRPVGQNQGNPFVSEEASGKVEPTRVKFHRHATGDSASSPAKPSNRRANSVSSGVPNESSLLGSIRNLNIVPVKQKVGSRHADVIDEWDGSGFGRSMLHHSGPYDAAAPSRNDVKKVGQSRAPMKAFRDVAGGVLPPAVGPGASGINQPESSKRLADVDFAENPFDDSLATSPLSPSELDKDFLPALGAGTASSSHQASRPAHKTHHKKHSLKHGQGVTSPRGEGLTGQYSTSLPASGGYFPAHGSGGAAGDDKDNWEGDERKRRQREREQKHKALQAAWGMDEPEPFEEFGYSPRYEEPNPYGEESPTEHNVTSNIPVQHVRSSSFKLGINTPESGDYSAARGTDGDGNSSTSAQAAIGGKAGLKRTRSLMQRLRSMRDSPNVPANSYHEEQQPSTPHSPFSEETLAIRGAVPEDDETPRTGSSASTQQSASGSSTTRKNSFLSRRRPSKMGSNGGDLPTSHSAAPVKLADELRSDETTNEREEYLATPGKEFATSSPTVNDVKSTPTPTKGILKNSTGYFPPSGTYGSSSEYNNNQSAARARNDGRDKALPLPPPPPGPVMPDWNAPSQGDAYRSRDDGYVPVNGGGANVKRKTSMLKKMRDRITKQP